MRVLLLHNIVNPHMTPVFEAISRAPDVDLTVAFFAEREADRTWTVGAEPKVNSVALPGRQLNLLLKWDTLSFHFNPRFGRFFREQSPDVVINAGWMSLTNWHAFFECRRRRVAHVLWAGSTRNEPSCQRSLTLPAVRYLVRHSDACASYGTASADYLMDLGANPGRVVPAYHCIDNARFLEQCNRVGSAVARRRQELGLANRQVVLFVGRMLERKGGDLLIDAVAQLARERPDLALVMVGEGPMRREWEARARRALPEVIVHFLGSRPLQELPLHYLASDVFVLPSLEEVWGLVVNEAALAGLPVIVSERCGAAFDLVEPGVNGERVPAGSVSALTDALRSVLRDPETTRRMGRESRRLVERCAPEKVAASLLHAAALARQHRSLDPSVGNRQQ